MAKLDRTQVDEIRRRYSDGEAKSRLGAEFGVSPRQITNIVLWKNWKD